jgi:hypothetical protein
LSGGKELPTRLSTSAKKKCSLKIYFNNINILSFNENIFCPQRELVRLASGKQARIERELSGKN